MTTSDRERFLAAVYTAPLIVSDAIVVLCGEDAQERANVALQLYKQGAAPVIVCAGALHEPPAKLSGQDIATWLMSQGLAPDRIIVEGGSTNTHEQAQHVVELAEANGWHRLLVVASSYHVPRAMLTFVKAVGARPLRIIPVSTSQLSWWTAPPGVAFTRLTLFDVELAKVDEYAADVATWGEGLAYLAERERT